MKALIVTETNEVRYFLWDESVIEANEQGVRITLPDGGLDMVISERPFSDYFIVENVEQEDIPSLPADYDGEGTIRYESGAFVYE